MRTWNDTALGGLLLACSLVFAVSCNSAFADEKKPYPKPHGSGSPAAGASASAKPPEPEARPVDGHKPWAPTLDVVLPDGAGVSFVCLKTTVDSDLCDDGAVVFPARRGDRRAFQFLRWGKWGPDPDALLTEQYLEGDTSPSISLQGVRWEF